MIKRTFSLIPWLIYGDVYKNYYANKQEKIGAVIHNPTEVIRTVTGVDIYAPRNPVELPYAAGDANLVLGRQGSIVVKFSGPTPLVNTIMISIDGVMTNIDEMFWVRNVFGNTVNYTGVKPEYQALLLDYWRFIDANDLVIRAPQITTFALQYIDDVRRKILRHTGDASAFLMSKGNENALYPYGLALEGGEAGYSAAMTQEGLFLKTYQSDRNNNWLRSEWITGSGGVNELSRVNVSAGYLEIEALNLAEKVYKMLNAIAASDKTYDGFQDAVWNHDRPKMVSSPVYLGGLSKELVFQEVVSNSAAASEEGDQPLGTLAARGRFNGKHKGGRVSVRINEPSYVTAYMSLTPRIDYSQANDFDMLLENLDQLHKPALDQIGFQDLVTDSMAWWDTGIAADGELMFKSAGKQPAWLDYMTAVNQVLGNFAIEDSEMYMVLNRRYEYEVVNNMPRIKDLTTYIDPSKFNHIFAQTSLDAQNFKVQVRRGVTARRKMSAKVMPNL